MNKLLRQFLSGGSLAALQLCALGGSARAIAPGTTISNTRTNVVINTNKDFILVSPTGHITGSLTNNATVGLNSFGIEVQTGAGIAGQVINGAAGVINASRTGIAIQSGADLVGGIKNLGKIQVLATAGPATAIRYDQTGGQALNLTNSGTILVSATGTRSSNLTDHASGVFENDVNAYHASPTLNLTNSGAVTLKALANVTASSGSVNALGVANGGLVQEVSNPASAILNLTNSAALHLQATAKATNTSGRANVSASAKQAILQIAAASAVVAGTVVTQTVTNSGALSLAAKATATASSHAAASARVFGAIGQGALRASDAELSLTNSGQLNLAAVANAKSTGSNAFATARLRNVVIQDVLNNTSSAGLAGKANLTLTNSGAMSLFAQGKGTGSHINASASLNVVFDQAAFYAGVVAEKITNSNTGTISVAAQATALGTSGDAVARAWVGAIFQQYANDESAPAAKSSIAQTISNSASLALAVTAKATEQFASSSAAQAHAGVSQVFDQVAQNVITTVQSLTNSGALTAGVKATALASNLHATGSRYSAVANARITEVFHQDANGTHVSSHKANSKITQTISNSGALTLGAVANAHVVAGTANASGSADARASAAIIDVFNQQAANATTISQSLTNSAALHLNATALAKYTGTRTERVDATALVRNVFQQTASDTGFTGAAIAQTINNSASLSLGVQASGLAAAAGSRGDVDVLAEASDVFHQSAKQGLTAAQTITNSGALSVAAIAKGTDLASRTVSGSDSMRAIVRDIFSQSASGNSAAHSAISQNVTNSGALTLSATANFKRGQAAQTGVNGSGRAFAEVNDLAYQSANGAVTIAQSIANSGAIVINAAAVGTAAGSAHKAYASALAVHLFSQYASGDALTGSAATQSISNTATLGLTLSAKAKGQNAFTNSSAAFGRAYASNLFHQVVRESLNATQVITNSAAITINAKATATGLGATASANARASALNLFHQIYSADASQVRGGTVSQAITNSGNINLTLAATAKGQAKLPTTNIGAGAFVEAEDLFYQHGQLSSQSSGTLSQSISNTGSVTVSESASSTTSGNVENAEAELIAIFRQEGFQSGTITQSLTSGGPISATLAATAKGGLSSAKAAVIVNDLISQYASQSTKVTQNLTISNTGSITIGGTATAVSAATGKLAKAIAETGGEAEIKQFVGDSSVASQTLVNNAAIKLTLAAVATGVTSASAAGDMTVPFMVQFDPAPNGGAVTQNLTNTGAITIALSGKAKGKTEANAHASVGAAVWEQYNNSTGKPVSQTLTNSASLSLAQLAMATATHAKAQASDTSDLINQTARGENGGTLTQIVTNSGALSLGQTALANGKTRATASAKFAIIAQQAGEEYTDVNQTLTNSGSVNLIGSVKALGANGLQNEAFARFSNLFEQTARSNLVTSAPGIFVNQTLTNSGALSIKDAATATGAGRIIARASGSDIFGQRNYNGGSLVTDKINNSGSLAISLTAKGKNSGAQRVSATATFNTVMRQYVNQSDEHGQAANLSITNSGNMTVALAATATGAAASRVSASASLNNIFEQVAENNNSASLSLTNSATIAVTNAAKATGKGFAQASASAQLAQQEYFENGAQNFTTAALSVSNSGKITMAEAGTAVATNSASASASAEGFGQVVGLISNKSVSATGSDSISNSGTVSLAAAAKATAGNRVRAFATAIGASQEIFQQGSSGGHGVGPINGTMSFANSGTFSVAANATVLSATPHVALVGTTPSLVFAQAIGAEALAGGYSYVHHENSRSTVFREGVASTFSLSNSGNFSVAAVAVGAGMDHAKATASAIGFKVVATSQIAGKLTSTSVVGTFEHVTKQFGGVPVHGSISNSGTMTVGATATGGKATANGISVAGSVHGESITNAINASLSVTAGGATALAAGIDLHNRMQLDSAVAHHSTGAYQVRSTARLDELTVPAANITGAVTNSGSLTVSATGTVSEKADGIAVNAAKVSNTILNTGVMNITASGPAAVANGFHLFQSNYGSTGTAFNRVPLVGPSSNGNATHHVRTRIGFVTFAGVLNNTGTITVTANASTGNGSANGIDVEGGSLQGGSVLNSGTINAIATGPTAIANGVLLSGGGAVGVSNRSGTINATATSSSGAATANGLFLSDGTLTGTILTGGNGTVTANGANGATANGWLIIGAGKLVMVGSGGVLNVNATATKGTAAANGINVQGGALTGSTITNSDTINTHATGATGTTPVANSILVAGTGAVTVANAGGTLSSLVTLGGATSYGNVINVTGASAAAITLSGGTIAGNIVEASGGNAITVSGGNTLFNGAINPSKALLGSVTIASTGTLTLGINGGLGAGNVWTGSFVQQGTLALNATTDTSVEGTIHAATATLSGPAVLNINLAGAAIPLSSTYKVVFTTGALTGTWSSVTAPDPTFLTAAGVYTANEADITLTRASFGAISGLTPNEQAVGNALETIYEAGGATGPLGSLTSALFALTPTQYADALQQLSGETVGDLVATDAADLQNMVDTVISHLDEDSGTGAVAGTALNSLGLPGVHPAQDEDMGPVSLWGGFIASGSQVSSTISSPSYHTHMNGLMAGADFTVSPNALLGIAVGYNNGGLRTARDQGGFNVIEVSGYGRYADPNEPWYVVGDLSYGGFRNTLHRTIAIPGLATSTLTGKFDSSTLALYGEAGYHLDSTIKLTPYAAISYLNADADPFTETGSFVAPLSVAKASSNATISYLGAWFSQTWMSDNLAITPSIKAAWEHDFNTNFWTVNAGFAPVSTVSFGINGSAYSKDAAFIDAGVTLNGGDNVSFGLNYQGRLSSDRTQSAIVGRIVFKF